VRDVQDDPVPRHCQVAVVGAGLTGLATAYALARSGVDVAVFEADTVGSGASGRTGGIVLEDTAQGRLAAVEDCIPTLQRLLLETGIVCELDLPGCWELTHEGRGDPQWQDGDRELAIQDTVPGGTLDPGRLLGDLARVVRGAGARLLEHAPVHEISGGSRLRLEVAQTVVVAEQVVLGLNAYTRSLVSTGADFHPALALALCTGALERGTIERIGIADRKPFYTVDLPYLWGRPLYWNDEERLILGGGLGFDASGEVRRIDCTSAEVVQSFAHLEERVRGLHPALAEIAIAFRWGGPLAFRAGGHPILCRHPDQPKIVLTGAYAGHGLALSVRMGELAARILLGYADPPAWGALD
jgi:glycine/D-amino acid oxidase-like deaminating enzyme